MPKKIESFILLFLFVSLFGISCSQIESFAVENSSGKDSIVAKENTEIGAEGYDTVSYFAAEKALQGNPQISAIYQGAKWYFSSLENKEKFLAATEKYIPGYNSYCPYSLSKGKILKGKPNYWKVINEKLYFFYNQEYADEFEKNPDELLKKANENWKKEN